MIRPAPQRYNLASALELAAGPATVCNTSRERRPAMGPDRRPPQPPSRLRRGAARGLLLLGVAALALDANEAAAKPRNRQSTSTLTAPIAPKPVIPLPDDGLGSQDVYIEADLMTDDKNTNVIDARGHVLARAQGRTLKADEVVYNRTTGAAHAVGHVMIANADGTIQYGSDIQLDDQMRTAVAIGFSSRQENNVTIAAGAAIRRTESVEQLNDAIYTPCDICTKSGANRTPTWSVKASRIIQDRDHEVVYYRNAIIMVKGVPVFWFPVFWHPDPTSPRRSGFLTPRLNFTTKRGFTYEQPYYWALTPSSDLTVAAQLNTRVAPLLEARYRQRFYSGQLDIRAGVTDSSNFNNHQFYDNASPRSYILGTGRFSFDRNWDWGFGIERVTDPTFFKRYSVTDVFTDRGPYPADTDRLLTQLYTQRQDTQSFVSVAALDFQSIRVYGQNPAGFPIFESNKTFPVVAPLIEARYDPTQPFLGGRVHALFSAVALSRARDVANVITPDGVVPSGPLETTFAIPPGTPTLTYRNSDRITVQADWERAFTLANGMRLSPFLLGRLDGYEITQATHAAVDNGGHDETVGRALGTVGIDFADPLARSFPGGSIILEPLAQLAVSPTVKPSTKIPNEDSVSLEFDETNLFALDRLPGFDVFEGGERLNVGGRATAYWGGGRNASILVGKVFRAEPDRVFQPQSGLQGVTSDWIVSATTVPVPGIALFTRSRLASDTFDLHREEAGVNFFFRRFAGSIRYAFEQNGLVQQNNGVSTIGRVENVEVHGEYFFRPNWGIGVNTTRDLVAQTFPVSQIALIYRDECIRVDVIYTHDDTYGAAIGNSDNITVRLTLATLGDTNTTGVRNKSAR